MKVDLVGFSQTKAHKVVLVVLAGFAALFLFLGAINMNSESDVRPTGMTISGPQSLTTSNIATHHYDMNIMAPRTHLVVTARPSTATRTPVVAEITEGNLIATIRPMRSNTGGRVARVASGETLIIELIPNEQGIYTFGGVIMITVRCGTERVIRATVSTPEQGNTSQVDFKMQLFRGGVATNNFTVSAGDIEQFVSYTLRPSLHIWDTHIQSGFRLFIQAEGETHGILPLGNTRINNMPRHEWDGTVTPLFMPDRIMGQLIANPNSSTTSRFTITARIGELEYRTIVTLTLTA
jgi:hypothetical protein